LKKILVTGFTGFIGSHLIPKLIPNYDVIGFSHSKNPKLKITQIKGDVTKIDKNIIPSKISTIIHLSAISDVDYCQKNPLESSRVNIVGTQKILELARKNDSNVIFLSTAHVFGKTKNPFLNENHNKNPQSIYAGTKLSGEILCESYSNSYGLDIGVARLFSVYGPNSPKHSVTESIIKQIISNNVIKLGNISSKRDFLYIKDAIDAILLIMKKNRDYDDYNIGSGESHTINHLCKILQKISKKEFIIKTSKMKIRKNESLEYRSDSSKLKKLGWKPNISLLTGLKITYDWHLNNSGKK
jgi:UDP-glucose 4-epimerase